MKNYKTGLILSLTGIYLLVVAAMLTLAIDQAIFLTRFYRVSASPSPATDFNNLRRLSFGNDLLILAIATAILCLLVRGRPRRLLPVSIIAVLIFVALNLYSGRHVLPQLLIWSTPNSLAEQYTQALAASDLKAALRLAGRSDDCKRFTTHTFQEHQAQLKQRGGNNQTEMSIQDTSVTKSTTFYDKPVPQRFIMMQPVPSQFVTIMAEMENGNTIWLNLKMRYAPFLGTRYICGQDIDD